MNLVNLADPVVVVGLARTALGAMGGKLASIAAPTLGARVIKTAVERAGVDGNNIDNVVMGCVLQAGLGQAPARQAALGGALSHGVCCTTVNKVCGSGMKAVMMAHDALMLGASTVAVAGGMESMSRAPYLLDKARSGYRLGHGALLDHMFTDGLEDAYEGNLMGVFAEATAQRFGLSREQQDAFALASVGKAKSAIKAGNFNGEIAPVTVRHKKAEVVVDEDEIPNGIKEEKIPLLRPAFTEDGTVTAANASAIADGAAALVLMRHSMASKLGVAPLAVIRGQAQFSCEPEWFTTAPIGAIEALQKATGWGGTDVDLYEINEAFAVVTMAAIESLSLDEHRVNVYGGACALGHPLGASGARILVSLISALRQRKQSRGIAALCIGGGEATALAVECV